MWPFKNKIKIEPKRFPYGTRYESYNSSIWSGLSIIEKFCMIVMPCMLCFMIYMMFQYFLYFPDLFMTFRIFIIFHDFHDFHYCSWFVMIFTIFHDFHDFSRFCTKKCHTMLYYRSNVIMIYNIIIISVHY